MFLLLTPSDEGCDDERLAEGDEIYSTQSGLTKNGFLGNGTGTNRKNCDGESDLGVSDCAEPSVMIHSADGTAAFTFWRIVTVTTNFKSVKCRSLCG